MKVSPTLASLPKRPMTYDELAKWLDYSVAFLREEVAKGHLRLRRPSAQLPRFLPCDIAEWLDRSASIPVND